MAHEKACVKVLHYQIGILCEPREGFLYQPRVEIPGIRLAFFRIAGADPLMRSLNVIICIRRSNSR